MKFGAHALIWSAEIDRDLLGRFAAIRRHGFDGVEMLIIRPEDVPVADVRRSLADSKLECTFSAILPPPLSAIDADAAVRRKAAEHIAEDIRVAAEAGARIVADRSTRRWDNSPAAAVPKTNGSGPWIATSPSATLCARTP